MIRRQNELYITQARNDPNYAQQPPNYRFSQAQYGMGGYNSQQQPYTGGSNVYAPPTGPPPVNRAPDGIKYPPPAYGPNNA